jgi:5-methylcytosine-specific restriction endonuclease McrA
MKQKGKYGRLWEHTRASFLAANPPNHQGYYVCYLCSKWIPANEITVDHVVARSREPGLRFVFSNLAFACSSCNEAKGSREIVKQQEPKEEKDELEGLW